MFKGALEFISCATQSIVQCSFYRIQLCGASLIIIDEDALFKGIFLKHFTLLFIFCVEHLFLHISIACVILLCICVHVQRCFMKPLDPPLVVCNVSCAQQVDCCTMFAQACHVPFLHFCCCCEWRYSFTSYISNILQHKTLQLVSQVCLSTTCFSYVIDFQNLML